MKQKKELSSEIENLSDKICIKLNEIEAMEEELSKSIKDKDSWLQELADLLDNNGYEIGSKIVLKNGRLLSLDQFFTATIPSQSSIDKCKDEDKRGDLIERKNDAMKWLIENNLDGIIKNNIIAMLPKGDNEVANKLSIELEKLEIPFTRDTSVHSSTLKATLKEVIGKGVAVPFETFNVQTGAIVKIK